MGGCKRFDAGFFFFFFFIFLAVSFVKWGRGLVTLLLFLYVTEEVGRKYVQDMPWPPAAKCNIITNKQTLVISPCVSVSL